MSLFKDILPKLEKSAKRTIYQRCGRGKEKTKIFF